MVCAGLGVAPLAPPRVTVASRLELGSLLASVVGAMSSRVASQVPQCFLTRVGLW